MDVIQRMRKSEIHRSVYVIEAADTICGIEKIFKVKVAITSKKALRSIFKGSKCKNAI
jgi:hypothetical protein